MRIEDFKLIDTKTIDISIIKTDYSKIYHQKGANKYNADQDIESIFGEINNYHQIGNAYIQ